MSETYNLSTSKNLYKKNYNYSIPQKNSTKYIFNLQLGFIDGSFTTFRKIDKNKCTNLIFKDDNIYYKNIKSYSINISVIKNDISKPFNNSGYIKNCMTFFSKQDNNIYIEFYKLNDNKTTCTCRYIDYDDLGMSVSPPF
ncbi:hypothetical protein crov460 [Cafeteria roenbergensis virus]|uniref:Uncharacterized protein n=1 Tax=Cafeteria roenbergensis virus (strain BV-PW1) TaxID=693272 RepID=E3T5N1_CROVB|nr:hypothetical protein crov460 [Cafeteria roenbergensis virus BV-PW1]ADO67494.1 hypothetical protein crov460 [Cafeteria roenbergensis virus BV-PW1]